MHVAVAGAALLELACSSAGRPPFTGADDGVADTTGRSDGGDPAAEAPGPARCEEGETTDCAAPIGRDQSFVLCGAGKRVCTGGLWTTCATQATSAPIWAWESANVGCDAPPETCPSEGAKRTCRKQLPPVTQTAGDCYDGTEVCSAGLWGPCIPES
jgi:hypothetical protein